MKSRFYRFGNSVGIGVAFEWGLWGPTRTLRVAFGPWAWSLLWDRRQSPAARESGCSNEVPTSPEGKPEN